MNNYIPRWTMNWAELELSTIHAAIQITAHNNYEYTQIVYMVQWCDYR